MGGRTGSEGKFADTGIEALLSAMESRGADPDRVVAKIAGGSDMLALAADRQVGARNIEAVRESSMRSTSRSPGRTSAETTAGRSS